MKRETLLWLIDDTVRQIQIESGKYKQTIKDGQPLSEAKQVQLKIKQLIEELRMLLSQDEFQGTTSKTQHN